MSDSLKKQVRQAPRLSLVAGACLLALSQGASAMEINTGNEDLAIRLDTTVRYNVGIRAKDCDTNICGNDAGAGDVTAWQSDRKFGKAGDVVTNRVDVLPEFDFVYKKRYGFRVSAAAWYDAAYSNKLPSDAAFTGIGAAGAGTGKYLPYTDRYILGPSGEFLDAFVFGGFDLGETPVNFKLGQHNVYWGESLYSFVSGVAYNQGPVDIRKAQANPGIEAKEVFKPINQLSLSAELGDGMSIAAQYAFDWKPTLLPEGGSYFGAADGLSMEGGGTIFTPVGAVPFGGVTADPKHKGGDFGLAFKWKSEMLDARMGAYYREYYEKMPALVATGFVFPFGPTIPVPTGFGLDYSSKKAKMLGLSLSKQVGDLSVGMDLTYRTDAALLANPFATPSGAILRSGALGAVDDLPRGKVVAGVVNAIAILGTNDVYDYAALTAELNFSHLQSVTSGAAFFKGEGYAGCDSSTTQSATMRGCATKNQLGLAINFVPTWYQVWSGVDVSAPMFFNMGLYGNSSVIFGDNKGQGSYSLGVSFDVDNTYAFDVKYNGYLGRHGNDSAGAASLNNAALGKYWDRDWVSFTFKTSF